METDITVTIKLFSGLAQEIPLKDFDPAKGLSLKIKKRTRLRKVLKNLGLKKLSSLVYFSKGEKISLWTKLNDGDEVSCLRPSAGG